MTSDHAQSLAEEESVPERLAKWSKRGGRFDPRRSHDSGEAPSDDHDGKGEPGLLRYLDGSVQRLSEASSEAAAEEVKRMLFNPHLFSYVAAPRRS